MRQRLSIILLISMLLLTACSNAIQPQNDSVPRGKYDPPRIVSDFTLTNQNSRQIKLSDLRGKVVWLFFGYTHCSDVCPLTMGMMKSVKDKLGGLANQVTFVFISVDGKRDTPNVVKQFVHSFDADFIGLTGDEVKVQQIAKDYSSQFDTPTTAPYDSHVESYMVGHTGYSYLLDRRGLWRFVYLPQTPVEMIVVDIKELLNS